MFDTLLIVLMILSDHHRRRLATLQDEYNKELDTIRREFDTEKELISQLHSTELQHLHDVMFAMEQNQQEKEGEARQDFQSMRDEIKNKVQPDAQLNTSVTIHSLNASTRNEGATL